MSNNKKDELFSLLFLTKLGYADYRDDIINYCSDLGPSKFVDIVLEFIKDPRFNKENKN